MATLNGKCNIAGSPDVQFRYKGKIVADTLANTATNENGQSIVTINESGLIDSKYLPSYVDDVIEYNSYSELPAIGEEGKIYITTDTSQTYRWSGSTYVGVGNNAAIEELTQKVADNEAVWAAALNDLKSDIAATSVTVDSALSTTSENPVQNKVIAKEINSVET
jgi:hypothetical protein